MANRTSALVILTTSLVAPWTAAAEPAPRTVSVTARGQASVVPDFVEIRLGVSTQSVQLADAKRDNDKTTAAVVAAAGKHAVAKDDLQLNIDISPLYDDRKSDELPKLRGYRISRQIDIKLRDFSKVEPMLSDALAAGVNIVHGLEYQSTKHHENQAEARRLAVEVAKEKATQLAQLNGHKLGKVLQISEDVDHSRGFDFAPKASAPPAPPPSARMQRGSDARYQVGLPQKPEDKPDAKGGNEKAEIPFAPGKLFVRITVNITFELRD